MKERKKKVFSSGDKLRVRKSYYTFTREYPKYIEVEKTGRRITAAGLRKAAVYIAVFFVIASVSFFGVKLAINISYAPIPQEEEQTNENIFGEKILLEGVKALYMPQEKISDEGYIENFIKQIKKKNCNSVVIDFKTEEGRRSYSSMNENAIIGACAMHDNDTVRRMLDIFTQEDIAVIARIFCFQDNRVATANGSVAVKYMNTEVNWLDGSDDKGGKAWLNPYSKSVRNYIADVARVCSTRAETTYLRQLTPAKRISQAETLC